MNKKALIVMTSHERGYYPPEVTHPFFELIKEGVEVDFASPKGGKAPMDPSSLDLEDPMNREFMSNPDWVRRLENSQRAREVDSNGYSAILFAGGHGTMWDFPEDANLARLASGIYDQGGVIAAVCHGPAALVNLMLSNGKYLVDGKEVSAFSDAEEEAAGLIQEMPFLLETRLRERGARYTQAPLWLEHVVVDERLVTGQNPASARKVGAEVARILQQVRP